jgi:hypothetical protein
MTQATFNDWEITARAVPEAVGKAGRNLERTDAGKQSSRVGIGNRSGSVRTFREVMPG